jgi:hypothetical protein
MTELPGCLRSLAHPTEVGSQVAVPKVENHRMRGCTNPLSRRESGTASTHAMPDPKELRISDPRTNGPRSTRAEVRPCWPLAASR